MSAPIGIFQTQGAAADAVEITAEVRKD